MFLISLVVALVEDEDGEAIVVDKLVVVTAAIAIADENTRRFGFRSGRMVGRRHLSIYIWTISSGRLFDDVNFARQASVSKLDTISALAVTDAAVEVEVVVEVVVEVTAVDEVVVVEVAAEVVEVVEIVVAAADEVGVAETKESRGDC